MSDLADSYMGAILAEMAVQLVGLDLPAVGARWTIQKLPMMRLAGQVVGAIWGIDDKPQEKGGTCGADDIDYTIGVAIGRPGNQSLTADIADKAFEREAIRQLFHHKPQSLAAAGAPIYDIVVRRGTMIEVAAFKQNVDVHAWIIRATTREPRQPL